MVNRNLSALQMTRGVPLQTDRAFATATFARTNTTFSMLRYTKLPGTLRLVVTRGWYSTVSNAGTGAVQ
jgi:hypothetical protein